MNLNLLRVFTVIWVLYIGLSTSAFAQRSEVKGRILDEKKQPLPYTSVVLLNHTDSSVIQFILSDADGKYIFKSINPGRYVIQALYNGYDIYQHGFELKSDESHLNPDFVLSTSTTTLNEALVIAKKIPMVFKGDTIVYNASAFNTKTSATVEDLLKKLPGVQVGKDGTVTAQGEKIVKVMVNGKEFFGNDPTKATQNINADQVEKVEVLERKTDKDAFIGVDDGSREKVINLVLKENANKGYFGKLEAGGGTEETYKIKGVVNYFKDDNQFTVIGNLNNLNQNGFSWREYYQMLNGANGVNFGQTTYWNSQNDWLGANEQGRQQNAVIGTNAHMKAGKGEADFSYFLMDRSNDLQSSTTSENYLPARTILGNTGYDAITNNGQHKLLGHYKFNADSLNFFEINGEFDLKNGDSNTASFARNETEERALLNNSLSQTFSNQQNINYKGKLVYIRKFKKNKHALTFESGAERNENDNSSSWANRIAYTDIDYSEVLPQQFNDNVNATGTIIYNHIGFQYNIVNKLFAGIDVDNKISSDKYNQARNNILTGENISTQSPSISTTYNTSKADLKLTKNSGREGWNLNAGVALANIDVTRDLTLSTPANFKKSYLFVLPHGYVSYRKPKRGRVGIWFNGTESLPSMGQINPVGDISNPTRLNSGNFNLDPMVNYNAGTHFSLRNASKNTSLFGNINGGFIPNAVAAKETRDSNNFSTSTFINHGTNKWFNQNLEYQFMVKKLKLEIGTSIGYNYFEFNNILNDINYLNTRNTFSGGIEFEFQFEDVSIDMGYSPEYTVQNSGLLTNAVTFWKHNISSEVQYQITDRLEFSVDYDLFYYNSQNIGQKQLVPILNGGIEWKLDSLQKWSIGITGYDMLKKAQSINRSFFGNSFYETRQNTITRFFMFNVAYTIKKGAKKEDPRMRWEH